MATWSEISADPRYQTAPPQLQERIRNDFFNQVIRPDIPEEVDAKTVRLDFDKRTDPMLQKPSYLEAVKDRAVANKQLGRELLDSAFGEEKSVVVAEAVDGGGRPAIERRGGPLSEEGYAKVKATYESGDQSVRDSLTGRPGVIGNAARMAEDSYRKSDEAVPVRVTDQRIESRRDRLMEEGLTPDTARNVAAQGGDAATVAKITQGIPDREIVDYAVDAVRDVAKIAPQTGKMVVDMARLTGEYVPIVGDILVNASDSLNDAINYFSSRQSPELQAKSLELQMLMQTGDRAQVTAFLAKNPSVMSSIAIPSAGSMLVAAGPGIAMRAIGASAEAATTATVATNALMNAGSAFSEAQGDPAARYTAALIAGGGTLLIGKLTGGGAEGAIARGFKSGASGIAGRIAEGGKIAGREYVQEFVEGGSEATGTQVAGVMSGKRDGINLQQIANQAQVEGAAGLLLGGGVGMAQALQKQQAQQRSDAAMDGISSATTVDEAIDLATATIETPLQTPPPKAKSADPGVGLKEYTGNLVADYFAQRQGADQLPAEATNVEPTAQPANVAEAPAVAPSDNRVGGVADLSDLAAGAGLDNPTGTPAPSSNSNQPAGDGNRGNDAVAEQETVASLRAKLDAADAANDLQAMADTGLALKDAVIKEAEADIGNGRMPAYRNGTVVYAVHPSPNRKYKYQVTAFNDTGALGDTQHNSMEDAVSSLGLHHGERMADAEAEAFMQNAAQAEVARNAPTIPETSSTKAGNVKPTAATEQPANASTQSAPSAVTQQGESLFGLSGAQIAAMQGGKMTGADQFPGYTPTQEQVDARAKSVKEAKEKENSALDAASNDDARIAALRDAGLPSNQVLQAANELNDGDDGLVKDLARIHNINMPAANDVSTNPQKVDTSAERVQETPKSAHEDLRPLVEAIAKRRAVAEGQLNKPKHYARILEAAKKMLNGEPVQLGRLRIDANELKGDKELHASAMRLIEIASQPAKQAKVAGTQAVEGYRAKVAEAKSADELKTIAGLIAKDKTLSDAQSQDLDAAVFAAMDKLAEIPAPKFKDLHEAYQNMLKGMLDVAPRQQSALVDMPVSSGLGDSSQRTEKTRLAPSNTAPQYEWMSDANAAWTVDDWQKAIRSYMLGKKPSVNIRRLIDAFSESEYGLNGKHPDEFGLSEQDAFDVDTFVDEAIAALGDATVAEIMARIAEESGETVSSTYFQAQLKEQINEAIEQRVREKARADAESQARETVADRGTESGGETDATRGEVTYQPPSSIKEAKDRWNGGFNGKEFVKPARGNNQLAIMQAVGNALDAGLSYNRDIDNFVAKELGVTDAQREAGRSEVDGGAFGYDVYLARKEVEAERLSGANAKEKSKLGLRIGENIGKVKLSDGKIASAATVEKLGDTTVTLIASRGPQKVRVTANYVDLTELAERAGNDYLKNKTSAPSPETFDLSGQSSEEVAAAERAVEDLRNAEAEAARKNKADTQRNDFVLSGSSRDADQAAARGAQDLFAQPASTPAEVAEAAEGVASSNTIVTDDMYQSAKAKLSKKLKPGRLNSNPFFDPENVELVTIIGAYHIEKGARTLAKFTKAMKSEAGKHWELLKERIEAVFDQSMRRWDMSHGKLDGRLQTTKSIRHEKEFLQQRLNEWVDIEGSVDGRPIEFWRDIAPLMKQVAEEIGISKVWIDAANQRIVTQMPKWLIDRNGDPGQVLWNTPGGFEERLRAKLNGKRWVLENWSNDPLEGGSYKSDDRLPIFEFENEPEFFSNNTVNLAAGVKPWWSLYDMRGKVIHPEESMPILPRTVKTGGYAFNAISRGRKARLFVLRNMGLEDLNALKSGVMNNPSIAVTDKPIIGFGEITFVGDRGIVQPKEAGHFLFSGDAWTIMSRANAADVLQPEPQSIGYQDTTSDVVDSMRDFGQDLIKSTDNLGKYWFNTEAHHFGPTTFRAYLSNKQFDTARAYNDELSGAADKAELKRLKKAAEDAGVNVDGLDSRMLEHKIVGDISINDFPYVLAPKQIVEHTEFMLREAGYTGAVVAYDAAKDNRLALLQELDATGTIQTKETDKGVALFSRSRQTDTPAFKRWFGDSKVVDTDGKPLMVYHGTREDFSVFDADAAPGAFEDDRGMFFFTNNASEASAYATGESQIGAAEGTPNVMAVYLSLQNPKIVTVEGRRTDPTMYYDEHGYYLTPDAKTAGHDGLIIENLDTGEKLFVAFKNTQIKSATGNRGTYDPDNPDITMSRGTGNGLSSSAGQSPATELNRGMVNHFNDDSWSNAYVAADMLPSLGGFVEATKAAFGGKIAAIQPTDAKFDIFNGINYGGTNYINLNANVEFINIVGHELYHDLERDRPDLHQWFAAQAKQYYQGIAEYQHKLNLLVQPGEKKYTIEKAESELLADFTGDALRDVEFVRALAKADPSKFKQLLNAITAWLKDVASKLTKRGLGSSQYFNDVDAMRKHLNRALLAYASGKRIDQVTLTSPAFSRERFSRPGLTTINGKAPQDLLQDADGEIGNDPIPPQETFIRLAQRKVQDDFNRFRVIQDWLESQGVELSEMSDVYSQEKLIHGRIAERIKDARAERVTLLKAVADTDHSLAHVQDFLLAQHALEANKQQRRLEPGNPEATAFGMSDDEAKAMLAEYTDDAFIAAANAIRAVTDGSRQLMVESGLIDQETADVWEALYQHYIPVKGAESTQGTGKKLSANGKVKRRLGHGKRDEAVIENIFRDQERVIIASEKNRLGMILLNLILKGNNENLATIGQPEKRKVFVPGKTVYEVRHKDAPIGVFETRKDATTFLSKMQQQGLSANDMAIAPSQGDPRIQAMARPMLADNELNVYVNGAAIRVQLNDPLLAAAYLGNGVEGANWFIQHSREVNRYFSAIYTGYSPAFIVTNMERDFSAGLLNITGLHGAKVATKVMADYPRSIADFLNYSITGKESPRLHAYRMGGGSTGAAWLSDIERLQVQMQVDFDDIVGFMHNAKKGQSAKAMRVLARKAGIPVLNLIQHLNAATENAMRLSVYSAVLESGKTETEALVASKEVTVNFNKRGEWARTLGGLYLFFNPAIQGPAAIVKAFMGPHKGQLMTAIGGMASVVYLLLATAFDDEDDEAWAKHRKEVIEGRKMILGMKEDGTTITVEMPYGYGFVAAAAAGIYDVQRGGDKQDAAKRLAFSFQNHFSPVQVYGEHGQIKVADLMPYEPLRIISRHAMNESKFGSEIYPASVFDETRPDALKMFRATRGSVAEMTTTWLSEKTGGTESQAGAIDISPETLRYFWNSLTGGAGTFIYDLANAGRLTMAAITEDDPEAAKAAMPGAEELPIIKAHVHKDTVRNTRSAYYDLRENVTKAQEDYSRAKRLNDARALDKMQSDEAFQETLMLGKYVEQVDAYAKYIRDQIDEIQASALSVGAKRLQILQLEKEEEDARNMAIKAMLDVRKD